MNIECLRSNASSAIYLTVALATPLEYASFRTQLIPLLLEWID